MTNAQSKIINFPEGYAVCIFEFEQNKPDDETQ